MTRNVVLTVIAGLLLAVQPIRADEPKENDLVGTWIPSDGMMEGKKLPENFLTNTKLILSEGKYSRIEGEGKEEGTFKVDFSQKPAVIDIVPSVGANQGKAIRAIIELSGDTMKVCYTATGADRPKDFVSTAENKFVVMVYKREKPKDGDKKDKDKEKK